MKLFVGNLVDFLANLKISGISLEKVSRKNLISFYSTSILQLIFRRMQLFKTLSLANQLISSLLHQKNCHFLKTCLLPSVSLSVHFFLDFLKKRYFFWLFVAPLFRVWRERVFWESFFNEPFSSDFGEHKRGKDEDEGCKWCVEYFHVDQQLNNSGGSGFFGCGTAETREWRKWRGKLRRRLNEKWRKERGKENVKREGEGFKKIYTYIRFGFCYEQRWATPLASDEGWLLRLNEPNAGVNELWGVHVNKYIRITYILNMN